MNAMMKSKPEQETPDERAVLAAAHKRRAQALAKREHGRQELERHKQVLSDKREALDRAIAAETEPSIDIADAPNLAQRRRDAEAEASAAERAQRAAQSKYDELCRAMDASESAVAAAVEDIFRAERLALAARISERMKEVRDLVAKLKEYAPDEINTPINVRLEIDPEVATALASVPRRDPMHTPVNVLRGELEPRADTLSARRAAMILGEADAATA